MKYSIFLFIVLFSFKAFSMEEVIQSFLVNIGHKNLEKISNLYEIKSKNKEGFLVYVLKEEVKKFKKLAPHSKMISSDINFNLKNKNQFLKEYRNFKEVREEINKYLTFYPDQTHLVKYGNSKDGNPLFALKVTDEKTITANKKKIMLTAATHGDELITVEVLLGLIDIILKKSKVDLRFKTFLENNDIYFIPVVNPDGFKRKSRYSHRVDPNRSYPMPDGQRRTKKRVKCIEELIVFYNKIGFDGSMDFHASGEMIMFPWAYTKDKITSSDFDHFHKTTKHMAKENKYKHGQISKVIYIAKGSSVDYYYSNNSGFALGIELATSKAPRASKIKAIINDASEMTWKYLESFN